ncbi:MAG: hypothetical protein AB1806_10175 [Acidobacteriota bacterium]
MRRALVLLIAANVGLQPAVARAQSAPPPSVESLGLSLERIKRGLDERPPTKDPSGLKLDFYVEVTALAPPIPIFQPGELTTGPVPWGAPTHADILNIVTPQAFKSPAVPIGTLAIMGIQQLIKMEMERQKRRKAEEERRKRDDELKKKYPYLVAEPKK